MSVRNPDDDTTVIEKVKCTGETAKALLVVIDEKELWVPKSVVHDDSEVYKQDTNGDLVLKRWWAEKEGIEP